MNDKMEFNAVLKSMKTLKFTDEAKRATFKLLSAILNLGNVEFSSLETQSSSKPTKNAPPKNIPPSQSYVAIKNKETVGVVANLLGVQQDQLELALTQRTLSTGANRRASVIKVPLDFDSALRARDAMAKALYSGLFDYVIEQVNLGIRVKGDIGEKLTIGILDIYGLYFFFFLFVFLFIFF